MTLQAEKPMQGWVDADKTMMQIPVKAISRERLVFVDNLIKSTWKRSVHRFGSDTVFSFSVQIAFACRWVRGTYPDGPLPIGYPRPTPTLLFAIFP